MTIYLQLAISEVTQHVALHGLSDTHLISPQVTSAPRSLGLFYFCPPPSVIDTSKGLASLSAIRLVAMSNDMEDFIRSAAVVDISCC